MKFRWYPPEEWWRDEDKHAAAIDTAYEESQIREIEAEISQGRKT